MSSLTAAARGALDLRRPTVDERRQALRSLATYPDDHEPWLLSIYVGALATCPNPAEVRDAWEELTACCALLTGIGTGDIEPRHVAPGAHPGTAYTVAVETLEEAAADALTRLVAGAA